jgi:hypothetical protein
MKSYPCRKCGREESASAGGKHSLVLKTHAIRNFMCTPCKKQQYLIRIGKFRGDYRCQGTNTIKDSEYTATRAPQDARSVIIAQNRS